MSGQRGSDDEIGGNTGVTAGQVKEAGSVTAGELTQRHDTIMIKI